MPKQLVSKLNHLHRALQVFDLVSSVDEVGVAIKVCELLFSETTGEELLSLRLGGIHRR